MDKVEHEKTNMLLNRPYSEAHFDGYHAAPLLIVGGHARPELIAAQDRLSKQFIDAAEYELGDIVKPDVVNFVAQSIARRMQQREGLNGSEYMKRSNTHRKLFGIPGANPIEVWRASRAAFYGRGSVAQNDLARRAFGMAATEYTNLTILGEFRKNLEAPMWDEVGELIGADATPHFEQMTNFQVLDFDRDVTSSNHVGAIRIGMKRELGELDDGTKVKARTTAIINARPSSDIKQSDVLAIREAFLEKQDMATVPEFLQVVHWLVDEALPEGVALARNETVYGFNQATFDKISDKRDHRY